MPVIPLLQRLRQENGISSMPAWDTRQIRGQWDFVSNKDIKTYINKKEFNKQVLKKT